MYFAASPMVCIRDLFEWCDNFLTSFINLAVPTCIALHVVIMNGISLMFIISIARVMLPCSSSIPSGNLSHEFIVTLLGTWPQTWPEYVLCAQDVSFCNRAVRDQIFLNIANIIICTRVNYSSVLPRIYKLQHNPLCWQGHEQCHFKHQRRLALLVNTQFIPSAFCVE